MPFTINHSPVTSNVRAIWQARQSRCDSWHLLLDKFSYQPAQAAVNQGESPKHNALLKIRETYSNARQNLTIAVERQTRFLARLAEQYGNRFHRLTLVNSSRLLLHLGRSNVLENIGIYCERITGLPIIPGSAVKGVLSTWACWEGNEAALYSPNAAGDVTLETNRASFNADAVRIFGDNSDSGSTAAGEIVFIGAFPMIPPVLELDIVTPHTRANGIDQNPVPSPFLAIKPGTPWSFAFIAKSRNGRDTSGLLETVTRWLTEALDQSGLGAKTAAGYGRFMNAKTWDEATLTPTGMAQKKAAEVKQIEKELMVAAIRASNIGDYTEATFSNAILKRLGKPGEYQLLQQEINVLQGNPNNAPWIPKITDALRTNKDARKSLKVKTWFPQEWLPQ